MRTGSMSFAIAVLLLCGVFIGTALAADSQDIDKMTTFATLIGRAAGCGMDTEPAMKKVGRWMDRHFSPGTSDQKTYLPVFITGVTHHAKMQNSGNSPDTCATVRREFNQVDWDSATRD